jgi:DNA-binding MarR family transcriptional regulator
VQSVSSAGQAVELRRMARELARMADELEGRVAAPPPEAFAERDRSLRAIARAAYRTRQERKRFLPEPLFSEPAWDMLLELFVAALDGKRIATKGLCGASGVPPSTAARYIDLLEETGLAVRSEDLADARRVFVAITPLGEQAMTAYLETLCSGRLGFAPELALLGTND